MNTGIYYDHLEARPDDRGRLIEMYRQSVAQRHGYGDKIKQVYMTTTKPGVVKGWHRHKKQVDNVICIKGEIKLVLYDPEDDMNLNDLNRGVFEFCMGEHHMMTVRIPPGVWHGWKCISNYDAIIVNCVTEEYDRSDPDEERRDPHCAIIKVKKPSRWPHLQTFITTEPYDWSTKDR